MADATSSIKTTRRNYAVPIGEFEYFTGTHYADGTWSQKVRVPVIAHYEEITTVIRGYKKRDGTLPAASTTDSMVMATVTFIRGQQATGNRVEASFDYEQSSRTVTMGRVSEAGFFEETIVEKTCKSIDPSF